MPYLPHFQKAPAPAIDGLHSSGYVSTRTTTGRRSTVESVLLLFALATTARPSADSHVLAPSEQTSAAARHRRVSDLSPLQGAVSIERELAEGLSSLRMHGAARAD